VEKKYSKTVEEIIEFARTKLEESKENVSVTVEDEKKRLQEIIEFARTKAGEATDEAKAQVEDIIKYAEAKLEELDKKAEEKVSEGLEEIKEKTEEGGFGDTITSAAKSFGNTLTGLARKLGKETSKISKVIGVRSEIGNLNNAKKDKVLELGENFLEIYEANPEEIILPAELRGVINEIKEIDSKLAAKNAELEQIQKEEDLTEEEIKEIEKEIEKG